MRTNEKLLAWRLKNDLSQRDAARAAGMSQPAWQSYEAGTAKPKGPNAAKIRVLTKGHIKEAEWLESDEEHAVRQARKAARTVGRKPAPSSPPRRTGTDG